VFFLESTRFVVPLVPALSAVQGAALREILTSVALIAVLRWRPQGLVPESRMHPVVASPLAAATHVSNS
jgi:branched-chain amino acid transport system permease protein